MNIQQYWLFGAKFLTLNTIGIIGSGFASMSAAAMLSKAGYSVHVFEKNEMPGGRARKFSANGFVFDMGPSWYWMPETFEKFYNIFGKKTSDFYELKRLDPSYRVFFSNNEQVDVPAEYDALEKWFDSVEPGSSKKLGKFLKEAEYKYSVGMNEFVWKPSLSILEFFDFRILKSLFKLQMFSSLAKEVDSLFKNEKLREILKFPVLFLGATPEKTPALYSLMNYADLKLGTWYPKKGMYEIVDAFYKIGLEQGVTFHFNEEVCSINVENNTAVGLTTLKQTYSFDYVIGGGDYHHMDQVLLPEKNRQYSSSYWDKRVMAPSSLLFYLGLSEKIDGLEHHNLFFDEDFSTHANEIYTKPSWPTKPLFYVSCPSKTDNTVAPEGKENMFILMPIAPDLQDNDNLRESYFNIMCDRIEERTGIDLRPLIEYKRSYCLSDFKSDYFAYKGNAYGLANTLFQTAFLKPKMKHTSVKNLFFTGQLTTPGPGVPPSIISGQVVANFIINNSR